MKIRGVHVYWYVFGISAAGIALSTAYTLARGEAPGPAASTLLAGYCLVFGYVLVKIFRGGTKDRPEFTGHDEPEDRKRGRHRPGRNARRRS